MGWSNYVQCDPREATQHLGLCSILPSGGPTDDENSAQVSESEYYDILWKYEKLRPSNSVGHRTVLDLCNLEVITERLISGTHAPAQPLPCSDMLFVEAPPCSSFLRYRLDCRGTVWVDKQHTRPPCATVSAISCCGESTDCRYRSGEPLLERTCAVNWCWCCELSPVGPCRSRR